MFRDNMVCVAVFYELFGMCSSFKGCLEHVAVFRGLTEVCSSV